MKLNQEFLLHNTDGEAILVPTGKADFSGVVRGNRTLGAVLELLKADTTEAALVDALKDRFDAPEGAVEADVRHALSELRKIGALDE
ncbi:MAG: PqqD family protein [Oscillospiraceae bacterium]|nr:PqqD family protein [Oscillospiraceae bacterium]